MLDGEVPVVAVAVAGAHVAVIVAAAAVAAVVLRSPFRLSIRLLVVVAAAAAAAEEEEQEGAAAALVVVVAISFAPAVMLPLLPRSNSKLVLPHLVHPMHLVLLHPQV